MTDEPKILVPAAKAAEMLSMGRSTFWREVAKGTLPKPVKIGGLTRWRVIDLQLCVAAPASRPTIASAPAA
jgi:predicted DNA-binding transcriptional regulator AlpA